MDLPSLIQALSEPAAYSHPVEVVEVHQTHISVVFLAGDYAYKIKKPVDLGFLDFSTLAERRHFCDKEVRLNRRLAPAVYLGVVPVTQSAKGVTVEGPGAVVEWAVKMVRLPAKATLESRLQRGEVTAEAMEALARRIAAFHAWAETNEHIATFGRFELVARNTRENFEQSAALVGHTISRVVAERLQALTEASLARLRPLIDGRAARGMIRDTHGDLHVDHVYLFPEKVPPEDLVIVDCIEFNERFRYADPVADMAFLVMDLAFHGRRDLARTFAEAYFQATGDAHGRALLPFYTAYRAAVRGKVEGLELVAREIPRAEREAALVKAQAHWLLALSELEEPARKPCLVLVGGLPGTGKSTLVQGLAEQAGFNVVRSDLVRKELAHVTGLNSLVCPFGDGIYSPEWTDRTYAACLRRVGDWLFEGKRVLVDASFCEATRRQAFLDAAVRWGVPGLFLLCRAQPETVRQRLAARQHNASDADWAVYLKMAEQWKEPEPRTGLYALEIITDEGQEQALHRALAVLREVGLQD
jgi:aminoglycoside phosphotransferase family enzyme/predicted kinase